MADLRSGGEERRRVMPYRKVSYLEQCWYLIKLGLKHGFGGGERQYAM